MSNEPGDSLLRKLGQLAREQDGEAPPSQLLSPSVDTARIVERALGKVAPAPRAVRERPRKRFFFALVLPLAGAAALLVLVPRARRPPGAPLPAYALEVSGGIAEVRGAEPTRGPLLLESGARVELRLRPQHPIDGAVGARLFWRAGRDLRRWPVRAEMSPEGVLRVIAPAESPFGPGDGELIAVVARPDILPEQTDLATLEAGHAGWQILRWPVRWR
jgi:hypothetical protein